MNRSTLNLKLGPNNGAVMVSGERNLNIEIYYSMASLR